MWRSTQQKQTGGYFGSQFESPVHQHREVMAATLEASQLTPFSIHSETLAQEVPPPSLAGETPWETCLEGHFYANSKSC